MQDFQSLDPKNIWDAKSYHFLLRIKAGALLDPEVRHNADLEVQKYINCVMLGKT